MATSNPSDPLVSIAEAAVHMKVRERQVRKILTKNLIHPVRTAEGVKYRLEDVLDVKRAHS